MTSLQVDAYAAFGYSPSQTLKLAQLLYENALISYPRTSSQQLPDKLDLRGIVSLLAKQEPFKQPASLILKTKLKPFNGKKTDPAHPAIHPTGEKPGKTVTPQALKLYDLVVRNFFATFAPRAEREKIAVIIKFGENMFKASGARTVSPGWLEFTPYHNVKDSVINLQEGQRVEADEIRLEQKETQPPKRYSPASIVRKLESLGLGTKATRSEVIETLYSRDYVADKKSIKVTPFGLSVYEALSLHSPRILDEALTHSFERQMEEIAEEKLEPEKVVETGKQTVSSICQELKQHEGEIGKHLLTALNTSLRQAAELGPCKCGGVLIMRRSKFGQFVGCNAYPNCKVTFPLPHKAAIIPTEKTCEKCGTPVIGVRRKGKKFFSMCLDPKCETKANWGNKSKQSNEGKT